MTDAELRDEFAKISERLEQIEKDIHLIYKKQHKLENMVYYRR